LAQRRYARHDVRKVVRKQSLSRDQALALVRTLARVIERLTWMPVGTPWVDYTSNNNYGAGAEESKREIVRDLVRGAHAQVVWDLGANTGEYSRVARESVSSVIAFDLDPAAVERNYRRVRAEGETGILPLLLDLTNPSPAQGWAHRERLSLDQRGPADLLLALALLHHLAIGHNLPLERIAGFLARLGRKAIVEFVPKSDTQVQRLLRNRPDIFPSYTREGFEEAFRQHFTIERTRSVADSERSLYLMTSCVAGERASVVG
jgi:ribosomal protein L11 methylase PrmA